MKSNKFLILVQNDDLVKDLRGKDVDFVYPLKFFCVGFTKYYNCDEIPNNAYLYVNKALDNNDYHKLEKLLKKNSYKGIIFDDLGVIEITKNMTIEKILYQPHQLANYRSINEMLNFVDSVIINTDITKDEIDIILDNCTKPLIIYGLGFISVMYSKRKLVSNYLSHHSIKLEGNIHIKANEKSFITLETLDGTVIYDSTCYANNLYNSSNNVHSIFINSLFIENQDILSFINNKNLSIETTEGFLNTKTVYKLKDGENNA